MNDKGRAPTISQVAKAAGVNPSSVSRAFSHPELLSHETVALIKATAEKLGYSPNRSAQALSTGRSGNIALVVPDVANPFFPPLIRGAQAEADRSAFCVFIGNTDEDLRKEELLLRRFSGQVDGVVLAAPQMPDERIRAYAERMPLVLVNRDVPGVPRVLIDSAPGIGEAVAHLAGCGHRRIAYIGGPGTSWSNKQRHSAIQKAAARHGLALVKVPNQLPSYEAGRQAVQSIEGAGVTAIVAFDDIIAQGVIAGLAARNIEVPRDVALVACDDTLGVATYPRLTTISNQSEAAGRAAVSLMNDILGSRVARDVRYVLGTHLVIRMTSGVPSPPPD
ncbi:LacI family DNA-binding transcriptional regulator [Dongia sedimenti]|uniref:LacI family DNA-binding transcriptional regulator n=1 Tax=Dongia sedimenti TaxID=3064282 RepID=A0ABU0YGM0_9PROT|nr:LacI family DNA-binding transcriptional regulator [Rhodospirillaceae bacterium R-7]